MATELFLTNGVEGDEATIVEADWLFKGETGEFDDKSDGRDGLPLTDEPSFKGTRREGGKGEVIELSVIYGVRGGGDGDGNPSPEAEFSFKGEVGGGRGAGAALEADFSLIGVASRSGGGGEGAWGTCLRVTSILGEER